MDKFRSCPYCSRKFKKNDHYNRHIRAHTQEKPYGCKLCGKFFPRSDTLHRHLKTHRMPLNNYDTSMAFDAARTTSGIDVGVTESHQDNGRGPPSAPYQLSQLEVGEITSTSTISPLQHLTSYDTDTRRLFTQPTSASLNSVAEDDVFAIDDSSNLEHSTFDQAETIAPIDATNWLLNEDFFNAEGMDFYWNDASSANDITHLSTASTEFNKESDRLPKVLDLRKMWYNQVQKHNLNSDSSRPERQDLTPQARDIDDTYRTNMADELSPRLSYGQLPSFDVLNLCINLYFTRFNSALPLIHAPTFMPSADNVLLVFNMCAAGAMTMISDMGAKVSSLLWERAIKSGNMNPWERGLADQPKQMPNYIQASLVGQACALLSGDPVHRTLTDAYHGGIVSIGRHLKLFSHTPEIDDIDRVSTSELENVWRQWVRCEELKRAATILHIQDAELAALFHHEPLFRHHKQHLYNVAPTNVFQAPTAAVWAQKYKTHLKHRKNRDANHQSRTPNRAAPQLLAVEQNIHTSSMLRSWAMLSGIGARIVECRQAALLSSDRITQFEAELVKWFNSDSNCCQRNVCLSTNKSELPFCLRPLWHYTFMTLMADLDLLEISVGREGADVSLSNLDRVKNWLSSADSRRCLLHALYLQKSMASTMLESSHGLHAPRILFSAALCWYSYMLYLPWCTTNSDSQRSHANDESLQFLRSTPEYQVLTNDQAHSSYTFDKVSTELHSILSKKRGEMKVGTLCVLESTLRRFGAGGVSRLFADLIQTFITGEA